VLTRVIINPSFGRRRQIESAVSDLNATQSKLIFELIESRDIPDSGSAPIEPWPFRADFFAAHPDLVGSEIVTECPFSDRWFSHTSAFGTIITTSDWEENHAPPSLKIYIQTELATHVVAKLADLTDELMWKQAHLETMGCLFDMCGEDKRHIKFKMLCGCICGRCRASLLEFGVTPIHLDSLDVMLDSVRLNAIGRQKFIDPQQVFIAMRFTENDENGNSYRYGVLPAVEADLRLKAIRADASPGTESLVAKVFRMIDESKYSLILVGEENLNVYFEYGYALGRTKPVIVVVRADKIASLPTDIRGFEYVVYDTGNYEQLRERLKQSLSAV